MVGFCRWSKTPVETVQDFDLPPDWVSSLPITQPSSSFFSSLVVVRNNATVVENPPSEKSAIGTDVHGIEHDAVHQQDDSLCFLGSLGLVDEEKDFPLYEHRIVVDSNINEETNNVSPFLSTFFSNIGAPLLVHSCCFVCVCVCKCFNCDFFLHCLGRTRSRKSCVFRRGSSSHVVRNELIGKWKSNVRGHGTYQRLRQQ